MCERVLIARFSVCLPSAVGYRDLKCVTSTVGSFIVGFDAYAYAQRSQCGDAQELELTKNGALQMTKTSSPLRRVRLETAFSAERHGIWQQIRSYPKWAVAFAVQQSAWWHLARLGDQGSIPLWREAAARPRSPLFHDVFSLHMKAFLWSRSTV